MGKGNLKGKGVKVEEDMGLSVLLMIVDKKERKVQLV